MLLKLQSHRTAQSTETYLIPFKMIDNIFKNFISLLCFNKWKIILILAVLVLLYNHYTRTFDYFKNKNIHYLKPKILIGSLGPRVFLKKSFHEFQLDIYNSFKGLPYGGKLIFL